MFLPLAAVRFGRIPKREKQRLLDEMQSYMNSLNEAPMDVVMSPESDAPPSPTAQEEEAISAISKAYHDIFVSGQDRLAKHNGPSGNEACSLTNYNEQEMNNSYSYGQYESATLRLSNYSSQEPPSYMDNSPRCFGNEIFQAQQAGYLHNAGRYPAFEFGYPEANPQRGCPWRGTNNRGIVSTSPLHGGNSCYTMW